MSSKARMDWTAEANAKLLLGILDQLKETNVKLNYQKLAMFMGPECSSRSIEYQLAKLKKAAGDTNAQSAPGTPATPSTPVGTPKKRRTPACAKSTPSKKKKVVKDEEEDNSSEEERNVKEVRDEIKNL